MSQRENLAKLFRETREARQLSIDDVAVKTYINPKVIRDIEEGNFERTSPVYMKSFLKKYSSLMGMDTENVLKMYSEISTDIPVQEFSVGSQKEKKERKDIQPEKDKKPKSGIFVPKSVKKPVTKKIFKPKMPVMPEISADKKVQLFMAAGLFLVLVFLLFVLIRVAGSVIGSSGKEDIPIAAVREQAPAVTETTSPPAAPAKEETPAPRRLWRSSQPTPSPVNLTLSARDRVWVQVASSEGGKIFDGFLNNGDSRSWRSSETLTVWTGKGEKLDFTVNGENVGVVAPGVARNIKVSSEGIRIGEEWAVRFE